MILNLAALACFIAAIVHTFLVKRLSHWALRYREGSVAENVLHLLAEVEIVFGLWAGVYLLILSGLTHWTLALQYFESLRFTEPVFVFVIMVISASKPITQAAQRYLVAFSRLLPLSRGQAFFCTVLILGPLLGSFITEPAAMTVTALVLLHGLYNQKVSQRLMYATLGLLFVNISIGGTLTPYAAPPVLMVAHTWNWDLNFMLTHFGWKAALAILISTSSLAFFFKKELGQLSLPNTPHTAIPFWVTGIHFMFLILVVMSAHHTALCLALFMVFLGVVTATQEYQNALRLREGLLVAFFLGGLVVLGGQQRWWLEPLLAPLNTLTLYLGSIGLTAFTDNAALTYLGSQIPSLSEASRYALVAGSVVGGGLTVVANAPNPVGFGLLKEAFGDEGISPLRLFLAALYPTLIAAFCFWIL